MNASLRSLLAPFWFGLAASGIIAAPNEFGSATPADRGARR
jgi:hypothetical protein